MNKFFYFLLVFVLQQFSFSQTAITFPSKDGLSISANLYEVKNSKKIILLCHQATYSKGEYNETAPKLNALGYTCLTIDQRSGDSINGSINQTAKLAKSKKLPTEYENAEQDIVAAIDYLYKKYKEKIIVIGSSYSSALILKIGVSEKNKISALVSFSPGEYFNDSTIINTSLKKVDIPTLITCAKPEVKRVQKLFDGVTNPKIEFFKPIETGNHGSKVLWSKNPNSKEYWDALLNFLKKI
jgi:predicted alpha/beta hydrolase